MQVASCGEKWSATCISLGRIIVAQQGGIERAKYRAELSCSIDIIKQGVDGICGVEVRGESVTRVSRWAEVNHIV